MIEIEAKLSTVRRVGLSGIGIIKQWDDNVVCITVRVVEGPKSFLDRKVRVEMGIDELVNLLPPEVARNLLEALEGKLSKEK